MTVKIDNIPMELRQCQQWVAWKYGKARADGKRPKIPINPHTGKEAKANDPTTWADFATAQAAVERWAIEGVGFMFADDGEYTGIDFDDCIVDGVLGAAVAGVVGVFDSYTEISPSSLGVKVWVRATKPAWAKCVKAGVLGCKQVEIYDKGRFFTVTGQRLPTAPATVASRQAELNDLCAELWPKSSGGEGATVCKSVIPSSAVSQLGGGAVGNALERCWKCILAMRESVSGEQGHNALLGAACTCFRFGLTDAQAAEMLERFNAERCRPLWTPAQLERKRTEGWKKVTAAGQFGELLRKTKAGTGKRHWHNHLPGWIQELPLKPYKRTILQAIADKCDRQPIDAVGSLGYAQVGYRGLAKECHMCERTAVRHVTSLQAMGLLVCVEPGGIDFRTGEIWANVYAVPGKLGALDGKGDGMTESHSVPSPPTLAYSDGSMQNCHTVGADAGDGIIVSAGDVPAER